MNTDSKRPPNLERVRSATAADLVDRLLDKGIVVECRKSDVLLSRIGFLVGVDARGVSVAPLGKARFLANTWFGEPTAKTPAPARRGHRR